MSNEDHAQFLMPTNSSISPSYVNWVRRGVIMSTRRSRIINESTFRETVDKESEDVEEAPDA